jgi:hypothetical protein
MCDNSGGNDRFDGLIRAPEVVNVFYGSVVSIRHHLNVRLFKYRIADKWNYRGHGFPHSSPLALRISPIPMRGYAKLTTFRAGQYSLTMSKAGGGVFRHGTWTHAGRIDLPGPALYIEGDEGRRLDG